MQLCDNCSPTVHVKTSILRYGAVWNLPMFRRNINPTLQISLKIQAHFSFETSVYFYQTTQRYILAT